VALLSKHVYKGGEGPISSKALVLWYYENVNVPNSFSKNALRKDGTPWLIKCSGHISLSDVEHFNTLPHVCRVATLAKQIEALHTLGHVIHHIITCFYLDLLWLGLVTSRKLKASFGSRNEYSIGKMNSYSQE
jgi:hypothetical protein